MGFKKQSVLGKRKCWAMVYPTHWKLISLTNSAAKALTHMCKSLCHDVDPKSPALLYPRAAL